MQTHDGAITGAADTEGCIVGENELLGAGDGRCDGVCEGLHDNVGGIVTLGGGEGDRPLGPGWAVA